MYKNNISSMAEKGKYMKFNKVNKCVLYVAIKINIIDC